MALKGKQQNTFQQLYLEHRNGHIGTFGRTLSYLSAFWKLVLIHWLGNESIRFWGIFNLKNPFVNAYKIPFKDGYPLALVGWVFWIWWGLVTVFLAVVYSGVAVACLGYVIVWLSLFCGISWAFLPVFVFSLFSELPASIVNRDLEIKKPEEKSRYGRNRPISVVVIIISCIPVVGWLSMLLWVAENDWSWYDWFHD